MGTNYYLKRPGVLATIKAAIAGAETFAEIKSLIDEAGDGDRMHIGKSSGGWCFSLHVYPGTGPGTLKEWLPLLRDGSIVDEYGVSVTYEEMIDIIVNRWGRMSDRPPGFNYAANHAEPGPRGLLRHEHGEFCIGHGDPGEPEGTWDLVVGDFS